MRDPSHEGARCCCVGCTAWRNERLAAWEPVVRAGRRYEAAKKAYNEKACLLWGPEGCEALCECSAAEAALLAALRALPPEHRPVVGGGT